MMSPFAVAPFIQSLKSYFVRDLDTRAGYIANDGDEIDFVRANIMSSRGKDGMNYLLLDIDDNAEVWPSTTPGHYHIVFKEPFNKRDFENVVETLHSAGIIARGNYNQYRTDGALYLRTPWVKKGMTDELVEKGEIGPTYDSVEEAANELRRAARYLGVNLGYDISKEINQRVKEENPF